MSLGGNAGHSDKYGPGPVGSVAPRHQHRLRWLPSLRTSVWPLVVTWATDINTDTSCSKTTDPDFALLGSTGHMASGQRRQRRPVTSACSSPQGEVPQHKIHFASLSFPFLHQIFAHCIGRWRWACLLGLRPLSSVLLFKQASHF